MNWQGNRVKKGENDVFVFLFPRKKEKKGSCFFNMFCQELEKFNAYSISDIARKNIMKTKMEIW